MEFIYQAKNKKGELVKGTIKTHDENEAIEILHKEGLVILSLKLKEKGMFKKDIASFFIRTRARDIINFTQQLSTLVEADVPLISGLTTLAKQSINPAFRKILNEIVEMVDAGNSLSSALSRYPDVFSNFYISLIRSGEKTGKLDHVLNELATYLEKQAEIRSKITGALIYPIFLLIAVIVVFIIMFFGIPFFGVPPVIPQILSIIKESGVEDIPLTTRILIFVSNILTRFWYLFFIGTILLIIWLYKYIKTKNGRERFDLLKIKLPILKRITVSIYIARLANTLSTLIKAGVPILESLEITSSVINNEIYRKLILETKDQVSRGLSISEVFLKNSEFIPLLLTQMISIGEKTGKLDFMLDNSAKFYNNEADSIIRNLPVIIEPVTILIFGIIVFIMVSAVLLPLYSIVQ